VRRVFPLPVLHKSSMAPSQPRRVFSAGEFAKATLHIFGCDVEHRGSVPDEPQPALTCQGASGRGNDSGFDFRLQRLRQHDVLPGCQCTSHGSERSPPRWQRDLLARHTFTEPVATAPRETAAGPIYLPR
jgi:hypothetical protein